MIDFENVSASHGATDVLHSITTRFALRRRTALLGRSGSGKSTLLRLINRLMEPSGGKILFAERELNQIDPLELRRSIGFVSQHLGLFPHWTARKQIERFHQHPQGVEELAGSLGLDPKQLDRYPHQLSGGQQQRVALARALASNPPVLLLDEPFSALDPLLRREMQDLVMRLDKTIVFVTHDLREAMRMGEQIVFLRDGYVAYDGPSRDIYAADDREVRAYLETLES